MATVTCKTADGVERTVTVESENTCPLYSYGEEHKEYTGTFEKASAPENPAYYNAPANSTPVAPPEAVLGKVRVFDEGAQTWSQIDDLSGTYYSVNASTIGAAVVVSSPWGTSSYWSNHIYTTCGITSNCFIVGYSNWWC